MVRIFEEASMLSPGFYSTCIHTPPWWSVFLEDSGRGQWHMHRASVAPG